MTSCKRCALLQVLEGSENIKRNRCQDIVLVEIRTQYSVTATAAKSHNSASVVSSFVESQMNFLLNARSFMTTGQFFTETG